MKINYVYVTTNLINGKKYVGEHSTNDINDGYLGSGYNLFRAIKKYGKHNFEKKILEFCESKQIAFELQEKYINEYDSLSPNGYNISPKGGHNVKNCFSEISKEKISKANKGKTPWLGKHHSSESKIKISNGGKGRVAWNKGRKSSDEERKRNSEAHKGQIAWNKGVPMKAETIEKLRKPKSEEHKQKLRKPKSEEGKSNIRNAARTFESRQKRSLNNKGKKRTNETKQKISIAAKNRKPISDETRKKMSESQKKRFNKIKSL